MMRRTYRLLLETDHDTGQVCATLPTLNHTSDFGETAEVALANLRFLAEGLVELLLERGDRVPASDSTDDEGVFPALRVEVPATVAVA